MKHKSAIELIDLKKHFSNISQGPLRVLNGITISFKQGVSYAITGVSGSGKSTLLFLIAGLDHSSSGSILVDGKMINKKQRKSDNEFLINKLGLVFQKPHLIKELTVIENIMLKGFSVGKPSDKTQAYGLLDQVGLLGKAEQYPSTLSGGQQQRVALARALYGRPSFLIADEPTAHLDSENKAVILNLMIELCARHNMGLIISTHDQEVAQSMDVIYNLAGGLLVNLQRKQDRKFLNKNSY